MREPLDHPMMADFVANLDRINLLAEKSQGFVWRLVEDSGSELSVEIFNDKYLVVNMSVWSSIEAVTAFTYHSSHKEVLRRRKEWFTAMTDMHMACWYVRENSIPLPQEGRARLIYMNEHGETPYAFTFKSSYGIPEMLEDLRFRNVP